MPITLPATSSSLACEIDSTGAMVSGILLEERNSSGANAGAEFPFCRPTHLGCQTDPGQTSASLEIEMLLEIEGTKCFNPKAARKSS